MTTRYQTEMRRCAGSARFGIEPHEAPVSTFPKQPSRKDGLGTMCAEHWKAYVKGLAEARQGRASSEPTATATTTAKRESRPRAKATEPKAPRKRAGASREPTARDLEVQRAEALIAQVDALPGPESAKRMGDADVQAALETSATARRMLAD